MNKNMINEAIMAVLKSGNVVFNNGVKFDLTYRGDDMFCLTTTNDTFSKHSVVEHLLKWNDEDERFMTSSEF